MAAYDGRGYFHRACFVRARARGQLPQRLVSGKDGNL